MAFRSASFKWTEQKLFKFLENPDEVVPGNVMIFLPIIWSSFRAQVTDPGLAGALSSANKTEGCKAMAVSQNVDTVQVIGGLAFVGSTFTLSQTTLIRSVVSLLAVLQYSQGRRAHDVLIGGPPRDPGCRRLQRLLQRVLCQVGGPFRTPACQLSLGPR